MTTNPSREIDAQIAIQLFGWKWYRANCGGWYLASSKYWYRCSYEFSRRSRSKLGRRNPKAYDWDVLLPRYSSGGTRVKSTLEARFQCKVEVKQTTRGYTARLNKGKKTFALAKGKTKGMAISLLALKVMGAMNASKKRR